jgi:hypothetical protein
MRRAGTPGSARVPEGAPDGPQGKVMNTRTIAVIALIIAVIVLVILLT